VAGAGTENWNVKREDGSYPPPPLDVTAHAWHHSPAQILLTINNGGSELGGWMPAFKNKLTENEKKALVSYIHSLWPAELQKKYDEKYN